MQILSTNSLFVGKVAIYLEQIDSTNAYAKKLLTKNKPIEGTAIYTDKQVAGRGQIGSKWFSEPYQNITLSAILYPHFLSISQQFQLNKAVSLAVLDLLKEYIRPELLKVKWPNDIYIANKKLGGILIENSLKGNFIKDTVIGIGLNINQRDFSATLPNPTSLAVETDENYNTVELIGKLCERIEQRYLQLKAKRPQLDKDYLACLLGYNEWRKFKLPQTDTIMDGKITGVNSNGRLQVQTNAHPLEFDLKEIQFIF